RFFRIVEGVSDWDAPSPVKEWTARDVVDHLGWLPGMLRGMGFDLGVPEEDSPLSKLRAQTDRVQEVLDGPEGEQRLETTRFGTMPVAQAIDRFYVFDLYAHAWDLARASGQELELDEDYAT